MQHKSFSTHLKKFILFLSALLVVFSITLVPPTQVAKAATITVTTTSDGIGGPDCTLRDAITAADTDSAAGGCPAGSGADTIVLASGAIYVLNVDGLPALHSEITIEGNGSTVERSSAGGTPEFRIFYLAANGDLTLNDITISNGDPLEEDLGGGIKNWGTLTMNNSTVSDNSGGGIITLEGSSVDLNDSSVSNNNGTGINNNYGSVVIDNSTVSGNTENVNGGGIHNYYGFVEIYNCTVNDNTGAGIVNLYGSVVIENSTVGGNTENTNGGGIHNYYGTADIVDSTFTDNSADSNGGGIYNRGTLTLTQSTVSGNTANGNGGGVWNYEEATLLHSTISGNEAILGSGIFHNNNGTIELTNTIVADQLSGADCNGDPVTSLGYNLDSDGSCNLATTGDLSNTNPQLGPLEDNGGPSLTHALLPGSPAIDAGSCSGYTADQRDYPRPVDIFNISNADNGCDMGAYEVQNLPPTVSGTQAGQYVDDNATIDPFTAVTIADPDDDSLTVIVSLNNANKGELTNLGGFTEGPSGTYTFTGSPTSATTDIRGLTFVPTENRKTPGSIDTTIFTISADDGIYDPVTDDTTTVIATSINDLPTITGTIAGQTVDDNATIDPFTGVTIADPDKNAQLTVIVSLDDPDKGVLTNLGGFVEGPSGTYTYDCSPSEATTAIQGLTFDPTENRVPVGDTDTTTITISADDSYDDPVTDDTTTVIATSINDTPTITGTATGQTVDDNDNVPPFTGVTIADPDKNTILTVIVSLDNPDKGDLTNLGGFVTGPAGTYTFTGSPTASTTAIQGLVFYPTSGRVPVGQTETTTFTISADDSFAAPVTDDTTTVIVTAVEEPNTPPSISGTVEGQTVDDNGTIDPFASVTISDPDTATITFTVSLDDPDKGDLVNLGGFVESPTGTFTFSGSPTESTTAIRGLTFDPTEDRVPVGQDETTTFSISADDGIAEPVTDDTTTVIVTAVDKTKKIFLPLVMRNFCSDFFDDFSNPSSGWEVVDDEYVRAEYLNGEYRVSPKKIDYIYSFTAPTCSRENYEVEVDVRWASTPGGSYGILFGALSDYSRYYIYHVDTYWQEFSVARRDTNGWTVVVPWTYSSAIKAGTASNHLKLTRNGTQYTLEVNGLNLGTWSDSSLTGSTFVGVMTFPYFNEPTYDTRFDNFSVKSLPGNAMPAQSGQEVPASISGANISPEKHHVAPASDSR